MNILIRFTLKNMKEKKFRLILILISITLSTASFFASMAIGKNLEDIFAAQMRSLVGDADIRVSAGENSTSGTFYTQVFDPYIDDAEYIFGGFFGYGSYPQAGGADLPLSIIGYELEDLEVCNPVQLMNHMEGEAFEGRHVVVGYKMATEQGLSVGDTIKVNAFGQKDSRFLVWGIAVDNGLFKSTGEQSNILIPKGTASRLAGSPGKVNSVIIKSKDGSTDALLEKLNEGLPAYEIVEAIPIEQIRESIAQVSSLFDIMLVLVILISIFIIYTSFKVIMMERIPVIGTFRSVGATKRSTNIILMGESMLYGTLGGVLGVLLGIGVLYGMTAVMAYDPYSKTSMDFNLSFSLVHVLSSILLAVVLALISSMIPILQVNKISVKDIVLNKIETRKKRGSIKYYIGIGLMVVSVGIPVVGLSKGNMILNVGCMVVSIIGLVMLIPIVIKGFIRLFGNGFSRVLGNEGYFAVKNINDNKNIVNNIVLLTIGIASLFMINVISYSIGVEVVNVYNSGKFDVWAWVNDIDDQDIRRITAVEGVTEAYGAYETYGVKISGTQETLGSISGINPNKFFDYWDYEILGDREAILSNLDQGRHLILNRSMAEKYEVDVGDTMTFEMNGRDKTYTITGLVVTLMNNGSMGLISDKYYKADYKPSGYTDIFIRTEGDPAIANEHIQDKFKDSGVWSRTIDDLEESNTQANNQILVLLQGFSALTMVIGIFGVFNNYLVNMLSRKTSLAMYRSVGMEMKQMRKMLYIESLTGGVIGGISGVAGGMLFVFLVGYVMRSMNLPVKIHVNHWLYIQSVLGGILVSVVASISPVVKSSKMQIIEAIKYE